mmetsp:Transcript_33409/g.55258  ORF Transcript_33409/g.55258 Transcript_33409/m.55258 type:complete len:252 (+) Transcript_33409:459-1214(+)
MSYGVLWIMGTAEGTDKGVASADASACSLSGSGASGVDSDAEEVTGADAGTKADGAADMSSVVSKIYGVASDMCAVSAAAAAAASSRLLRSAVWILIAFFSSIWAYRAKRRNFLFSAVTRRRARNCRVQHCRMMAAAISRWSSSSLESPSGLLLLVKDSKIFPNHRGENICGGGESLVEISLMVLSFEEDLFSYLTEDFVRMITGLTPTLEAFCCRRAVRTRLPRYKDCNLVAASFRISCSSSQPSSRAFS